MKKLAFLTTALVIPAAIVCAQVATVSRTTPGPSGQSVMQNAAATNYISNDGQTLIAIRNGTGAAVTGTAVTQKTSVSKSGYSSAPLTNASIPVPANSTVLAGPFPKDQWNTVQGTIQVNLTSTTGISITSVKVK